MNQGRHACSLLATDLIATSPQSRAPEHQPPPINRMDALLIYRASTNPRGHALALPLVDMFGSTTAQIPSLPQSIPTSTSPFHRRNTARLQRTRDRSPLSRKIRIRVSAAWRPTSAPQPLARKSSLGRLPIKQALFSPFEVCHHQTPLRISQASSAPPLSYQQHGTETPYSFHHAHHK